MTDKGIKKIWLHNVFVSYLLGDIHLLSNDIKLEKIKFITGIVYLFLFIFGIICMDNAKKRNTRLTNYNL